MRIQLKAGAELARATITQVHPNGSYDLQVDGLGLMRFVSQSSLRCADGKGVNHTRDAVYTSLFFHCD